MVLSFRSSDSQRAPLHAVMIAEIDTAVQLEPKSKLFECGAAL